MKSREINVLHLASFTGNIGDNANHLGSQSLFEKYFDVTFKVFKLEIREFYRKKRHFDHFLLDEMNSYDLVIIGGGNYFELWPENSKSGTSIDLGPDELAMLRVPIIFYSLGVDVGQGITVSNKEKFRSFLKYLKSKPEQFFVSVRNDGALENLRHLYGNEFDDYVKKIPDGGFFSSFDCDQSFKRNGEKLIGVNLAGDMLNQRFSQAEDNFIREFSETVSKILSDHKNTKLVFFNHIPKDFFVSSKILNSLKDEFARERTIFAPYLQGDEGAQKIFGLYKACDLMLANRFHANVVPLSMGIPTVGLSNYIQIENLYRDLELDDNLVDISNSGFGPKLVEVATRLLSKNPDDIVRGQNVIRKVKSEADASLHFLASWVHKKFIS